MSLPPNIEKFNVVTAKTLVMLYEAFPLRRDLLMEPDYGIPHVAEIRETPDGVYPLERAEILFVQSTIEWLHNAEYIEAESYDYPYRFLGVVLTAKGLEILKAIPATLSTDKTAGELVTEAVKSGVAQSMGDAVKFVLAEGVKFMPYLAKAIS